MVPTAARVRPTILKAFDAEFRNGALRRVLDVPAELMPRLTTNEQPRARQAGQRTHGGMRLKSSFPELLGVDPSAKDEVPASAKVEGYLLSEAEYIRAFGY